MCNGCAGTSAPRQARLCLRHTLKPSLLGEDFLLDGVSLENRLDYPRHSQALYTQVLVPLAQLPVGPSASGEEAPAQAALVQAVSQVRQVQHSMLLHLLFPDFLTGQWQIKKLLINKLRPCEL